MNTKPVIIITSWMKQKCRHFHYWLHWKLTFWLHPVHPAMKNCSKWRHFRFRFPSQKSWCPVFPCQSPKIRFVVSMLQITHGIAFENSTSATMFKSPAFIINFLKQVNVCHQQTLLKYCNSDPYEMHKMNITPFHHQSKINVIRHFIRKFLAVCPSSWVPVLSLFWLSW